MPKGNLEQRIETAEKAINYLEDCDRYADNRINDLEVEFVVLQKNYEELRAMVIDNLIENNGVNTSEWDQTLREEIENAVTLATTNVAKKFGFPPFKGGA